MLYNVSLCYVILFYVIYVMLYYVVLCCVVLCYVMVQHVGYVLVILKMNQQNFEKLETALIKPLQAPLNFMIVSYPYNNLYSTDLLCVNHHNNKTKLQTNYIVKTITIVPL